MRPSFPMARDPRPCRDQHFSRHYRLRAEFCGGWLGLAFEVSPTAVCGRSAAGMTLPLRPGTHDNAPAEREGPSGCCAGTASGMTEGNAMTEQRHSSRWPRAAVGRIAPLAARCRQPARYLHGLTVLSATVALKEPQSYRNRSLPRSHRADFSRSWNGVDGVC